MDFAFYNVPSTVPVQCNVQILNGIKSPAERFGLVIIKISKNIYTTLATILYDTEPTKKIIKTSVKHYNEFRNVITEDLRWLQMTKNTGIKFKFET